MLKREKYVEYEEYLTTLNILSKDDDNNKILIDDTDMSRRMYHLDEIKNEICKKFRGEPNSSCDAYWEKGGMRYFIEFKNQGEGNIKRVKLLNKAYDSITLLLMNENITREELIKNTVLIVVYNNHEQRYDSSSYNPSNSMDKFTKKLGQYAGRPSIDRAPIKFKLGKLRGTLYHEVYTLEVKDFKKQFFPILFG